MRKLLSAAAVALPLSGCGLAAEFGFIDESYKGSFIRGDAYADACHAAGGSWSWAPGQDARCEIDLSKVF